jgi:formate hydrogenlyase subunit 6/NADH:ubiquinone oxidoreductase subunit I
MASRFLEAWGGAAIIACQSEDAVMVERAVWESTNPPLSRRDLFRMMARQGSIALARAAEEGHSADERKVGRDRLRTVGAVRNLSREHPTPSSNCGVFGFASLRVSDACTACGVCANACPTGALHFEVTNSNRSFSLRFSGPDCIDCGICEDVCAAAAISIDHDPAFKDVFGPDEPVSVQRGELTRCTQCNTLMAARPGIKLCPLCSYRRKNPFGTKMPPGMNVSKFSVKRKGDS